MSLRRWQRPWVAFEQHLPFDRNSTVADRLYTVHAVRGPEVANAAPPRRCGCVQDIGGCGGVTPSVHRAATTGTVQKAFASSTRVCRPRTNTALALAAFKVEAPMRSSICALRCGTSYSRPKIRRF